MKLNQMCFTTLVAVLAVVACAGGSGKTPAQTRPAGLQLKEDAPEAVKRFVAGDRARKVAEIERLRAFAEIVQSRIREAEKKGGGSAERTREAVVKVLRKNLKELEGTIRALREDAELFYPPAYSPSDLRAGFIGRIDKAKVKRVVDGENVVISVLTMKMPLPDEIDSFDELPMDETDVWLTNYDTAGMVDGRILTGYWVAERYVDLKLIIRIEGTKKYRESDGKDRMLPVAQPFAIERWIRPSAHDASSRPTTRPAGPVP